MQKLIVAAALLIVLALELLNNHQSIMRTNEVRNRAAVAVQPDFAEVLYLERRSLGAGLRVVDLARFLGICLIWMEVSRTKQRSAMRHDLS